MLKSWLICAGLGVVLSLVSSSPLPAEEIVDQDRFLSPDVRGMSLAARRDARSESNTKKKRTEDKATPATPSGAQPPTDSRVQPDADGAQARLGPDTPRSDAAAAKKFDHLEIEVSHSRHFFKLLGKTPGGADDVLHECNVGLGSREFPTPVGVYYVTHIFDDNPWWIPPPNRAWAAGQSPSRRIYGGIMAPLLKKRPLKDKKTVVSKDDKIEKKVKLDDYGYRFHGTNQPRSIGHNQSHGCVRMIPADAKKVAEIIKQYVGIASREESENGTFVVLKAPVRLNLIR